MTCSPRFWKRWLPNFC